MVDRTSLALLIFACDEALIERLVRQVYQRDRAETFLPRYLVSYGLRF